MTAAPMTISGSVPSYGARFRDGFKFYWFTSAFRAGKFLPKHDISRYLEYALVFEHLDLADSQRVLDIGSGYSIFPLYLASAQRYHIHITDNEANLSGVIQFHHAKLRKLGLIRDLNEGKVVVEQQDARQLSYSDAFFNRITCISVIEHIPGTGDSEAMREIGRVLRPGGLAVLTFPYAKEYQERQSSPWVEYFERSYDERAIQDRLLRPSGLVEVKRLYFGEWPFEISRMYQSDLPRPVRILFEISTPLWATLFMRVWTEPTQTSYGVVLVLRKE